MRRRVDIKAILANPEARRSLLRRAVAFIIGVGADFRISHAEATKRAERNNGGQDANRT